MASNEIAIDVVCNSPRHQNRMASLARFDRDSKGKWHIGRCPGERRRARQAAKRRTAGKRPSLALVDELLDMTPLKCKLCGERLSGWRDARTMVPILNCLAEQNESLVCISKIKHLLSTSA